MQGLLGNDSAQSSFIAAYANTRFPVSASSSRPASHQPAQSSSNSPRPMNQASVPVKSKPTAAAAPLPQAARSLAPGFPSQSSNAKIQVIQAPAVNVALPPTEQSRPSTSARTIEHVSGEAAAEVARRRVRQIEQRLRAAKGQSKEKACFCQGKFAVYLCKIKIGLIYFWMQPKNIHFLQ